MRQRAACAARLERELLNKKSGFSCINPGCQDTRLFCGIIPVKAGWLVGMCSMTDCVMENKENVNECKAAPDQAYSVKVVVIIMMI